MDIGKNLKLLRVERNLKQEELAKAVGSAASTISEIERGVRSPGSTMVKKLADFFGVTVDFVMRDEISSSGEGIAELKSQVETLITQVKELKASVERSPDPLKQIPPEIVARCPAVIDTVICNKLDKLFGVRVRTNLLDYDIANYIYRYLWCVAETRGWRPQFAERPYG